MRPADPARVMAAATAWLGTPYHHQASTPGAGCDCLGLARGVWRALCGAEPETPPPYSRDWGETGGRELLRDAARRAMIEVAVDAAGPGALVLFRMRARGPAKHCGILLEGGRFIHARERLGVVIHPYDAGWRRRAAYAFLYPER